jgi:hypothetical protein
MAEITIKKFYTLDSGEISGMFSISKEKATKALRHELIELEGVEAEITPVKAPALITEPLCPGDIRIKIQEHLMAIDNLSVQMMGVTLLAPKKEAPAPGAIELPLGRDAGGAPVSEETEEESK